MPSFSRTRAEAAFLASVRPTTRCMPAVANAQSTTARAASLANPLPWWRRASPRSPPRRTGAGSDGLFRGASRATCGHGTPACDPQMPRERLPHRGEVGEMRGVSLERAAEERHCVRRAAREARRLGRTRLTAVLQPAPLAGRERRAPSVRPQEPEDRLHLGIDRPIRSQDTVLLAAHDVDRRVRVEWARKCGERLVDHRWRDRGRGEERRERRAHTRDRKRGSL